MNIIRFILLVFLVLVGRRFYLALKHRVSRGPSRSARHTAGPAGGGHQENPQGMEDLTEQDISDADFEEIP